MATESGPNPAPPTQALIVDSNATSRSILVGQLREYGVTRIVQCSRVQDARARLEHTVFDYVLCDQFFGESNYSGQTLPDDLRRAQLLPFSTVFFMVTAEASYAAVAEAAESALDGYLLKPFTPSALFERLSLARLRKIHLKPIFDAIEAEDFEQAAALCVERFEARKPYWLYAARIGSELLLRLGRHDEARTLFEAVIAARALPWAKLGVARAQIESGQAARAITTLQELIGEDASFADAYDVLGHAQVEMGNFAQAIETYRTASTLTPDSVVRLQKLGMMSYYMGDRATATKVLARATVLGIDSKLFDYQSLVLLTFAYFAENDRKGIERCMADFARILERHHSSARIRRFAEVARALQLTWAATRAGLCKTCWPRPSAPSTPNCWIWPSRCCCATARAWPRPSRCRQPSTHCAPAWVRPRQGPSWGKTASGTLAVWHCGCAAAATTHRHASHHLRKTASH